MEKVTYPQQWDLDVFFNGGSSSPELTKHLEEYTQKTKAFEKNVKSFETPRSNTDIEKVRKLMEEAKSVMMGLYQSGAFASCLEAQDTKDVGANVLRGKMTSIFADFGTAFTAFQQKLSATSKDVWHSLIQDDELKTFSFVLNEWREKSKERLSEDEEGLIQALSVDGYHAWGQMYNTIISSMNIQVTVDGEEKTLSIGQANNLSSHKDPAVREEVFHKLEEAWKEKESLFAETLNHLGGFRLNVYKKRGWDHVLKEPLDINRMQQQTLDAMWEAISKNKQPFVEFLQRKAA